MLSQEVIGQPHFHNMVGTSEPMLGIHELIDMISYPKAPVLVVGESGTGKELIARAIHDNSPRRDHAFVAVNCAAMAHTLWESEMFGHEQGAFTGAVAMKKGRFECAHKGTLLLDEVSEMSPSLQVKLLRVLQEMAFERVGGIRTIKVDARIIAATNQDLKKGVEEGWFRKDLLFRLNVITIHVPPLRDRKEDILPLVDHFLALYSSETGKRIRRVSHEAMEALTDYAYPGNVRELENIIYRAVILAKEKEITIQDLPEEVSNRSREDHLSSKSKVETQRLLAALKEATTSDNGGPPRLWHQTLQCVGPETILEFFLKAEAKPFSRIEFTNFLSCRSKSNRNKYGTAGKYLSVLRKNGICMHNGKKANQSRYRLSEVFLS